MTGGGRLAEPGNGRTWPTGSPPVPASPGCGLDSPGGRCASGRDLSGTRRNGPADNTSEVVPGSVTPPQILGVAASDTFGRATSHRRLVSGITGTYGTGPPGRYPQAAAPRRALSPSGTTTAPRRCAVPGAVVRGESAAPTKSPRQTLEQPVAAGAPAVYAQPPAHPPRHRRSAIAQVEAGVTAEPLAAPPDQTHESSPVDGSSPSALAAALTKLWSIRSASSGRADPRTASSDTIAARPSATHSNSSRRSSANRRFWPRVASASSSGVRASRDRSERRANADATSASLLTVRSSLTAPSPRRRARAPTPV